MELLSSSVILLSNKINTVRTLHNFFHSYRYSTPISFIKEHIKHVTSVTDKLSTNGRYLRSKVKNEMDKEAAGMWPMVNFILRRMTRI